MAVQVTDGEVRLTGTVGAYFWEDGFTAAEVSAALAQVGRANDVTVVVNSGGGIATEGAAIHAILAGHKGKVTGRVEGLAASAASLAILGADEVEIAPGATFMIHEVSTVAWGDADEMRRAVDMLDTMSGTYAEVYADETGKSAAEIRAMMKAETWMSPQQAVDMGFADRVGAAPKGEVQITAFAYGAYAKAPPHLVAQAQARGWTPASARAKASNAPPAPPANPPPANNTPPAAAIDPAVAAKIMEMCTAAGQPALAAQLVRERASEAEAQTRLTAVKGIHQAVADARKLNPAAVPADHAAKMLARGLTVMQAKAEIMDLLAGAGGGAELVTDLPPQGNAAGWQKAVGRLKAAAPAANAGGQGSAGGWKKAIARLPGSA